MSFLSACFVFKMIEIWVCLNVHGNELALMEKLKSKVEEGRKHNDFSKVLGNIGRRTRDH